MLIILEGPDLAGKSTLAHQLTAQLAVEDPNKTVINLHKGPPTAHPYEEYIIPLLTYEPGGPFHYILDRWHFGEYIYPAIVGRKTKMTYAVLRNIEAFLLSRGAVMVFVTALEKEIHDRYMMRGDDTQSLATIQMVARIYRREIIGTILPLTISTDKRDIITIARRHESAATDFHNFFQEWFNGDQRKDRA